MKLSLLAFVLLSSALPAYEAHAAACGSTIIAGVAHDADADSAVIPPRPGYYGTSIMGYDYHQGRFFGHCLLDCFIQADIQGSDDYRIQGAAAGVPIHIHVEFRANLGAGVYRDCSDYCGMEDFGLAIAIHCSQTIHSDEHGDSAIYCFCWAGGTVSFPIRQTV